MDSKECGQEAITLREYIKDFHKSAKPLGHCSEVKLKSGKVFELRAGVRGLALMELLLTSCIYNEITYFKPIGGSFYTECYGPDA